MMQANNEVQDLDDDWDEDSNSGEDSEEPVDDGDWSF